MIDADTADILDGFKRASVLNKIPQYIGKAFRIGEHAVTDPRTAKRVRAGLRRSAMTSAPESFALELPMIGAEKFTGKDKIRKRIYHAISEPAMAADIAAGKVLQKIPYAKKLFTQEERIPWGAAKDKLEKTFERPSAIAPVSKTTKVLTPLIVGEGIASGMRSPMPTDTKKTASFGDMMNEVEIRKVAQAEHMDRQVREKVASTMLRLHKANKEHEKQAQAMRLIYKKAELGLEAAPQSYDELMDKVASVMGQDMAILEKALELTAGGPSFGELASGESLSPSNAQETFQSQVLA